MIKKYILFVITFISINKVYSQAWQTIPTTSQPKIKQLVHITDSEMYAVTQISTYPHKIMKWDGISWEYLGDFSSTYGTYMQFNSPTDIYAAKNENYPSALTGIGSNYNNISHWNGSSWEYLTNINRRHGIGKFAILSPTEMYAVGDVKTSQTSGWNCVLQYDGTNVTPVGINSSAYGTRSRNISLQVNSSNDIYSKYDSYDETIIRLKHWNGTSWNVFYNMQLDEVKGCGDFHVNSLNDIYICGSENNSSGKIAIGHWNGTYWEKIGDIYQDLNISTGNYGGVKFVYKSPNEIYIYGGLHKIDAPTYNKYQVAYWNGTNWSYLGNLNASIYPNTMVVDDNFVYVTGDFSENGVYPIKKFPRQINLNTNEFSTTKKNSINIFPNPTSDKLELSENVSKANLFSADGKLIFEKNDTRELDISSLEKGYYFLKVIKNEKYSSETFKVFKN